MEHIGFVNLSAIQCFEGIDFNTNPDQYEDRNIIETQDNNYNEAKSETLNIYPSISTNLLVDENNTIIKTPVVLAQLTIPFNISSPIHLPQKAFEIKDIEERLILEECILLQSTNVLFIKGLINKNIKYSTKETKHYTINIPFKYSTEIDFSTPALDPIISKKEVFQYDEKDLSQFNQISKEFFNERPFCKLISSTIIEFNKYSNPNKSEKGFTKILQNMNIELTIEILQNQIIAIPSSSNNDTKT